MKGLKIGLFVFLGLLAMVQPSMQISVKKVSHKIKPLNDDVSYFALVFTSNTTEKALNDSGFFTPDSYTDILGRRFVTGTIYGADVVYVTSASTPSVHVGITVQILANYYNIKGVISVGTAGTTNETISLGSVVVPRRVGFTGAWNWLSKDSNETGQLVFGDFNYPETGENLLGSIEYDDIQEYTHGVIETGFWMDANPVWNRYAARVQIDGVDVIVGLNASSSDIYVNNPAYREFLYKTFQVSIVDTDSAAASLGALTNDVMFIAFKGVSNYAGAGSGESETLLANTNVIKAVARFIWLQVVPRAYHRHEY